MSPIAPFFSEWLYKNLTDNIRANALKNNTPLQYPSVHLTHLTKSDEKKMDADLIQSMDYAQQICSLVHSIRKNSKVKVRTPLQKILLPILHNDFARQVKSVENIILSEVNVKTIEYIDDTSDVVVKKAKPNFAKLGKQYGPKMKEVSALINAFSKEDISTMEKNGTLSREGFDLVLEDVLISSEDIPGWSVATENGVTVALDINITEELKKEGIARDFVNRIQNLRKDMGLEVLDKIAVEVQAADPVFENAIKDFHDYISTEIQALQLETKPTIENATEIEIDEFVANVNVRVVSTSST
jgi:isoleucyl-tRNA synthetase